MYVIRLSTITGELYKSIYDEGFQTTIDLNLATQFSNTQEARSMLMSQGVQQFYPNAIIESLKQKK